MQFSAGAFAFVQPSVQHIYVLRDPGFSTSHFESFRTNRLYHSGANPSFLSELENMAKVATTEYNSRQRGGERAGGRGTISGNETRDVV